MDQRRERVALGSVALSAVACLALAACGSSGSNISKVASESSRQSTYKVAPALLKRSASPSDAMLDGDSGANWPTVGGDLGNDRYSALEEITTENVSHLHLVWQGSFSPKLNAVSLEAESSPLVVDGVMYIVTPESNVVAVNAATGEKVWEWRSETKQSEVRTQPPTGVEGLAVGDGMVFVQTRAAKLVAIDVGTGGEVWSRVVALGESRLESPTTPVYYDGVVYIGVSGAEDARGHMEAYDARTGDLLWRTFTTCGPTEVPPGDGQCPQVYNNPTTGGGSIWTWPAFDIKDGLLFVSTANPSPDTGVKGDFKWTTSLMALDMKTGKIKWGFQEVHHDLWDYDCATPPVLFENEFDGQVKQAVNSVCKTDLHFELEQATGKPLIPIKEEPVPTAADGKTPDVVAQQEAAASETQPIPENSDKSEVVPHCANEALLPQPAPDGSKLIYSCIFAAPGSKAFIAYGIGAIGGQDGKTPLSYDPKTGAMYYCEAVSVEAQKAGTMARAGSPLGVNHGWQGSLAAVDVKNNTLDWRDKYMAPVGACRGGVATTAGGLAFSSANAGKFAAYDAKTGKELWSFQGPSDVQAAPIVFAAGGHEYVAIYYGGQAPVVGGMINKHYARMLVFSVDGDTMPSARQMPKSEFTSTELEARKLAAEGAVSAAEEQKRLAEIIRQAFGGAAGSEEESSTGAHGR